MLDHVCLQSPWDQHKEWAMVSFLTVALHPVIMFYEHLGCGKDGMAVHRFNKSFSVFLGKTDTLAHFAKNDHFFFFFLRKYFRKRDINWSVWRIFCIKQQIFMLCKYHWGERFVLKVDWFWWLWNKSTFTFEKCTMKLTAKNPTVIWDVTLLVVWRNIQVEISSSVRRRKNNEAGNK